ncbi:PREDICTED: xanthine dehydrogenase/oxidase-like [Branchiostoma belcheri]|uniref:Xanthine dehydrogenase/oxidase-like n=1 Tax=Branchiostoma belcheri TaxID=7741 RepID=A0A6P4ZDJ6_BRABE|nr:PREDICTED: xanthine dehydrogenase/oxidase-like [Branchiostoma belcheri]XP_019627737.1 PREDICTED: xanthine dehydrogenase/oxidase-like [Branchiostoma belcheri]
MPVRPEGQEAFQEELRFWVNGRYHVVSNPDPGMTLNKWLRSQRGLTGTKVMCGEGGCGCCVVMVTHPDLTNGGTLSYTLNSCLCPLCSVDGWTITTVEGLGGQKAGFHPIQRRLAEFNGSQCGYCSPGMVVNMYGLLTKNPQPSQQEVENHFDGHICRCTGYRPILDAMKSFAADADPEKGGCIDIEDLSKHHCPNSGGVCSNAAVNCTKGNPLLRCDQNGVTWYRPTTLEQLYSLLEQHCTSQNRYKLVCGNTASGVYKNDGPYSCLIDIKAVPDLHICQAGPPLVAGSALSLSALLDMLQTGSDRSPSYGVLAEHLRKVANVSVRNVGSWAGNLMMKHAYPEFPSDVFTIMEAAGAKVTLGWKDDSQTVAVTDFLKTDMNGKVILSLEIPPASPDEIFQTYKVAPRLQNAHAYVNAGFRMSVDRQNGSVVTAKPAIVFGGVNKDLVHASATEDFIVGRKVTDAETLRGALAILEAELKPDNSALQSAEYTKQLATGLFYKFYLCAVGRESLSEFVRSAVDPLVRPVSRGEQHFKTSEAEWPVRKPLPKTTARVQASGEAIYTNDLPRTAGEVCAALVTSAVANCKLGTLEFSHAMDMPGAVTCLTAKDIKGENNCNVPFISPVTPRIELLSTGEVLHAGQPLAVVIADTQSHADAMAEAVKVTYTDLKPPILTIHDAIAAESFHYPVFEKTKGDPIGALAGAPHRISGEVASSAQHHFYMETQACRCAPSEDGMEVQAATQAPDMVQTAVAQATGISAHRLYVSVKRVGGAFGGKTFGSLIPAAVCAVAAQNINRPVRLSLNLATNMEAITKRAPYVLKYEVGFDDAGRLIAVVYNLFEDNGSSAQCSFIPILPAFAENVYYCPNWQFTGQTCKTHTVPTTMARAPGISAVHFFMEHIIEHVAKTLNMDPMDVRRANMFQNGQTTLSGHTLLDCSVTKLWDDLLESAEVKQRKQMVEDFNKEHRWKKRGLSVVPCRFAVHTNFFRFTVFVAIYHTDGSVVITHGGVEMGQGIDTRVTQVAAATLGVPMEMIHVMSTNSLTSPNSSDTGGSVTSELNCQGVLECCRRLNERLNPIRQEMGGAPTWAELINMCHRKGVDLSEKYMEHHPPKSPHPTYNSWGVTCTEVEMDVLTGEREIRRSDILFDCGESVNPALDIGQVEGAFVLGLGYWLTEKCVYDKDTGRLLTNGTWEYKPPTTKDIPADLRVTLLPNAPNPYNVIRSKAVGEPPLLMSCSALFALKQAIQTARQDSGIGDDFFSLDGPATVEACHQHCLVDSSSFTL